MATTQEDEYGSVQRLRRVSRYSLDLDAEQHRFLRSFALNNDINAALVVRGLLFLLETDFNVANRLIDILELPDE